MAVTPWSGTVKGAALKKSYSIATGGAVVAGLIYAGAAAAQQPPEAWVGRTRVGSGGADGPGLTLDWHTVDGGGATFLTGGLFALGSTAGQADAGRMSGGGFELGGGFWYGVQSAGSCYANCDGSTGTPQLTANDFQCFVNSFAAGSAYANCDGSTGTPALTANDFQCFVNTFAGGCT